MHEDQLKSLRTHVLDLLKGGEAHISPDKALPDFPEKLRGVKVAKFPHTAWQCLNTCALRNGTSSNTRGIQNINLRHGHRDIGQKVESRPIAMRGRTAWISSLLT